ncbi:hypothetical protein FGIG_00765 [Fasciola gigantica]|uniref:Uncharacterized protein n=1 Tax=Fasciola gigantica TaxID=46835 RepID=A0A504YET7_FASGI|nr:hypothetical protein FGIG_00765 [Fasciola gigantica]
MTAQVEDLRAQTQQIGSASRSHFLRSELQTVSQHIQRGLVEAECLVVVNDYIKSMESELECARKLVQTVTLKNRSLQRRILHKHQERLDRIYECEMLQLHLKAWRFALSLYDPGYSCLAHVLDDGIIDVSKHNKTECDVPTNLSSMPWICLRTTKLEFWARVNQLVQLGQLDRAVKVTMETFGLQKLVSASQRHRWLPHCLLELTKVLDYLSALALHCFLEDLYELALVCANHAVRLLLSISPNRSTKIIDVKQTTPFDFIGYIEEQLTSATIHETEWAVLLECCRRLIQVFWLTKRHQEAVSLLLGILGARRILIGQDEKSEGWKGSSQLACLITGGLCLFSSHVNQLSLISYGREDHITMSLTDLAMNWLEAALSVHLCRIRDERSGQLREAVQGPAFYLWSISTAILGRQCADVGAVYDIFLLATRVLSILAQIEPWRTECAQSMTQIISRALNAECEMGGQNSTNEYYTTSETVTTKDCQVKTLDMYLENIQCTELIGPIEALIQEVILVCRGQKWETAAALLEWWVIGCQMHRQRAAVRRRRSKPDCTVKSCGKGTMSDQPLQTDDTRGSYNNSESNTKIILTLSKYRTIHVRFIHFLIQLHTLNFTSNKTFDQNSSQLIVGKHRDCVPDELVCNLFESGQDFRISCFLPAFNQLVPGTINLLEQLASRQVKSSSSTFLPGDNQFILASNRKLLAWWKHIHASERRSDLLQIQSFASPFLDGRSLVHLWEESVQFLQNEMRTAITNIRGNGPPSSTECSESPTRLLRRFQFRPLMVTHDIVHLVRENSDVSAVGIPDSDERIPDTVLFNKCLPTSNADSAPIKEFHSISSADELSLRQETMKNRRLTPLTGRLRYWIRFRRKSAKNTNSETQYRKHWKTVKFKYPPVSVHL